MNFIKIFSTNFQKLNDYQLITFSSPSFGGNRIYAWKVLFSPSFSTSLISNIMFEKATKTMCSWMNNWNTTMMMRKMEICEHPKNRRWNLRLTMIFTTSWTSSIHSHSSTSFFTIFNSHSPFKMQLVFPSTIQRAKYEDCDDSNDHTRS